MTWYRIRGHAWPAKLTLTIFALLSLWAICFLLSGCHTPTSTNRYTLDTIDCATITQRSLATTFHINETITPIITIPSDGVMSAVALPPPFVRTATITAQARDTSTTTTHATTSSTTTHTTQPNISTPWPFSLKVEWPRLFFVLLALLAIVLILRHLR